MPIQHGSRTRRLSHIRSADLRERINSVISRAIDWSLQDQADGGYWVGMLESNACMEAQWILAQHLLDIEPDHFHDGVVQAIVGSQRADGAWEIYRNAPNGDINTTVECYAALRVAGFSPNDPRMENARRWIFENGGLAEVRVFTRYWLAMLGEWPWETTPTLPPELIFLPTWSPIHLYSFASWARATIVPLCILSARRPVRMSPEDRRLDELFPDGRESFDFRFRNTSTPLSIGWCFHLIDRFLSRYVHSPVRPFRENAIRQCLEWIQKHQDADGAWGGIQPPWIYSLLAMHNEGYPKSHPAMVAGLQAFRTHWSYERDGAVHLQASDSIVWDTVLMLLALDDCNAEDGDTEEAGDAISRAVEWVLSQQVFAPGDWQVNTPGVEPGGWAFERANRAYPDCDDTAVAMLALIRVRNQMPEHQQTRIDHALDRAEAWLRAMQCQNGGWAAFDRDNTNRLVTKIPFADFGEMLDPPSVDVTAHVVEALAARGHGRKDPAIGRAMDYMLREQEDDGSWFGRWGVNHVYGTGAVLPALRAAGLSLQHSAWERALRWIVEHQNDDGGWGETPASYMDDSQRGQGPSTASQTAWAMIGLLAAGSHEYDAAIRRGAEFLAHRQREDGTWDEPEYTGTGFPGYGVGERRTRRRGGREKHVALEQGVELQRGFMINYNLYRHYFPMMALGRARRHLHL